MSIHTPSPDHRTIALQKLADLALRRTALKEALAPFLTQVAVIQKACTEATAAEATAIDHIEEDLKKMALTHGIDIFGTEARSITHGLFMLALKASQKVECLSDEDEVIATLSKAAKDHPDQATRLAAASCLRVKTEINKPFIRENWELFAPWFTVFGLSLVDTVSASIVEKKPTQPKPAKPKQQRQPKAGEEQLNQEAA